MNGVRALMLVVAGACLVPAQACAQSEDPEYRALIDEAIQEFGALRFPEARALFTRAHAISPNARTLRGIGMTSFELRDYVEAYRALAAALVDTSRPLTDEQAEEARGLVERSARFLGLYRVATTPTSATLSVDGGEPVRAPDGRVLLALGHHELVATADGHAEARASVDVRGGEDLELTLELRSTAVGEPAGELGTPIDERPAPLPPVSDPTAGIALVIAGGAASAAAVVIGLGSWLTRDDELSTCARAGAACENLDQLRGERDAVAAATIGLGVLGAGAVVTGAVLLATTGGEPASAAVSCLPSGTGVTCVGRF